MLTILHRWNTSKPDGIYLLNDDGSEELLRLAVDEEKPYVIQRQFMTLKEVKEKYGKDYPNK